VQCHHNERYCDLKKPPLVTRGWKNKILVLKTEVLGEKIDWLAYTLKNNEGWAFCDNIDQHWKKVSPLKNYTHAEENKQGVRRYWNTVSSKQGRMVVCSGGVCSQEGYPIQEHLLSVHTENSKCTRIDFCLDVMYSDFKPHACVTHLRTGNCITHARSIPRIADEWKGGFTQYVGTKSSETYSRIYDKQVEQKTDYAWVRVETVYQGARAEPALSAYLQHKSTRRLILAHVDFPKWKAWRRVMSGDKAKLTYPPRVSATRKWLLEQVAKSVAKEIAQDDDHAFWFTFADKIRDEYRELIGVEEIINW